MKTFLKRILTPSSRKLEACREFKATVNSRKNNYSVIQQRVGALQTARDEAVGTFRAELTQEAFDALVEAEENWRKADGALSQMNLQLPFLNESLERTKEGREVLLGAIEVLGKRIRSKVEEIELNTRKELEGNGLDYADPPALVELREQLKKYDDAAARLRDWDETDSDRNPWALYGGLVNEI